MDPERITWPDHSGFLDYTAAKGRALLQARQPSL
jgi:hypothetical protein